MPRYTLGLILLLAAGCAGKNTVAGTDKTKAEQLQASLPSWCDSACARLRACNSNDDCACAGDECSCSGVGSDCPADCRKSLGEFAAGGDDCAAVGQRIMHCIDATGCDALLHTSSCQPTDAEERLCPRQDDSIDTPPSGSDGPQATGGTSAGGGSPSGDPNAPAGDPGATPVTCNSGSGGGTAGSAGSASGPSSGVICESYFEECNDGHTYSWICSQTSQGSRVCSCLVDSTASGAFAPGPECPTTAEANTGCGWNLSPFL